MRRWSVAAARPSEGTNEQAVFVLPEPEGTGNLPENKAFSLPLFPITLHRLPIHALRVSYLVIAKPLFETFNVELPSYKVDPV